MIYSRELPLLSHDRVQSVHKDDYGVICAVMMAISLAYCVYIGIMDPALVGENSGSLDAASIMLIQKVKVLIISSGILFLSLWTMGYKTEIPEEPYNAERETWFGHKMSEEGEWKHIPAVLCATYSFVLSYGSIVSLIAGPSMHVLTIPAFYIIGLIAFYIWHVAAHEWEDSELHREHMRHHQVRYPQHDFYGDFNDHVQTQRRARDSKPHTTLSLMRPMGSATTNTIAHEGPLVLAVIAIVVGANLILGVTLLGCAFALVGFVFMSLFGSAIHISFHERDFELEPYAWYRELRALHLIHHMHHKNYAMVNVILDMIFCSFLLSNH